MKTIFLFLCSSLLPAVNAAPLFAPKPLSPRSLKIEKRSIPLVKEGKVLFQLYVPGSASPVLRSGASEFAALLSAVCGQKIIPVKKIVPGKVTLYYGDAALAKRRGIALDKLDRDGFVIAAAGNDLLLAGGDVLDDKFGQGTLFSGYEFLERFAGVRFYFPGKMGTIIPAKKNWEIPAVTLYDRPDNQFRKIHWDFKEQKWYDPSIPPLQAKRLHRQHLRLSTMSLPNCHGLRYLMLLERFGKTHPEYFAMRDDGSRFLGQPGPDKNNLAGQLCFSQPGLLEEIYQDAKAVLAGQSAASRGVVQPDGRVRWGMHGKPFFNMMPNDSMARCRCPGCRPHFDPRNTKARFTKEGNRFIWNWLLKIPKRLKKEGVPGFVTMMAYDLCKEIPEESFPDNVILQVATRGPWNELNKELQHKDDELVKAWCKKTGSKIYLWNYATKLVVRSLPEVPNFTPRCVGSYYKRMFPYSFGSFLEAESDYWFFGHLNFYIFSKMMWDHTADHESIIDEYCSLMFGKGAAPMRQIFNALEHHWLTEIFGKAVETPVGPLNLPPSDYKLWNEIYSPAEIKRINALFDSAVKLAGKDNDARDRIRYVQKFLWQPTCDAAKLYERNNLAVEHWKSPVGKSVGAPVIDGKGNDAAWQKAPQIFLLPVKSEKAEVQTSVKLLADKESFYFLFDCAEPETGKMTRRFRKNDDKMLWLENSVELFLDPAGTKKEYFQLIVNPEGVIADLRKKSGDPNLDWSWSSHAEVKTSIIPGKSWIAEIKIPRSVFPGAGKATLFANFTRHRVLNGQKVLPYYQWSPYAKEFNDLHNFGTLELEKKEDKNLISDPDFTVTGLKGPEKSGWFNWGPMPLRDTEIFRTAGVSMRLEGKRSHIIHRLEKLKPNTSYRLSFFLKLEKVQLLPGKKQGGFYVKVNQANGTNFIFPRVALNGDIPWLRLEYKFKTTAKPSKKIPYVHFSTRDCTGRTWLDHVCLEEI